ncbi:MAG: acetyltransferase, partial [Fusobacterium periodonticum]|nr:acetyltransferase [Fusobacterium periodonticum]
EENKTVVKNTDTIEAKDYTFIGDSVMKMGEPYIKEIFRDANVDAKVSRQFTDLPKILEELKGSKKLRNTVVIHLGTNGVINKEAFESSMRMLKGKKVYIMNTVVPKPWEKSVNKSLAEWSQEYDNITIIDWHKYAKGEKQLFYKDATHPKPEGAKKYAEFIFKNIKR